MDVLDRHDGVYIVRMKPFQEAENVQISIKYMGEHVADSPYTIAGKKDDNIFSRVFKSFHLSYVLCIFSVIKVYFSNISLHQNV